MAEVLEKSMYTQQLGDAFEQKRPVICMENDNKPAIGMLQSIGPTKRSKFIDLRHQFIKQTIQNTDTTIIHVPSQELCADMFTKPLERARFAKVRELLQVREIRDIEKDIMRTQVHSPPQGGALT